MAKSNDNVVAEIVPLRSIVPDGHNANKGTERGEYMVRRSLEEFAFLEPGVLDVNNVIIGGNKRTVAAADVLNAEDALVIDIDGTRPVFVRRRDLDIESARGRLAAVALNRAPQVSISWDLPVLDDYLEMGVDLSAFWTGREMDVMRVAHESGTDDFLGEFVDNLTAVRQEKARDAGEPLYDALVQIAMPCTAEQRDRVMAGLRTIRNRQNIDLLIDALVWAVDAAVASSSEGADRDEA